MKKILYSIVIFAITALVAVNISKVAIATGSPLQISPFHGDGNSPCGVFYTPPAYSFSYNGGTVWLSSLSNGTGNIYTDDKLDIEVTRSDGTKTTFSKNYGDGTTITPTTPQDVTNLFKSGTNSVKVTMIDIYPPFCNSSEYWLVETTNGGGTVPAKPNVLPRSTWHGENNGVVVNQTANHIVIHHARSTNDPGNIGYYARELNLAWNLDKVGTVKSLFNPANVLSRYDSQYNTIRNTWPGQIWLEWLNHKYLQNYGDIAYHYLVDPQGNIYEGRWKGTLGENADNKGSSVWHANTGIIAITVLGRYGIDPGENPAAVAIFDGGIAQPTNTSIQGVQSLVDWLSGKYGIGKTGKFQLPPSVGGEDSCKLSPDQCFVDNIAGHKDFPPKTLDPLGSVCPGDNLYAFLPKLRGISSQQATGTTVAHKNPVGILIGGFSPIVLGVVDPLGNRLGIDPATGQYATNVSNGIYGRVSLSDNAGGTAEDIPYWLHIPTPISGVYKIDVVGTGTGAFTLATEDLQTSSARAINGSTTNGAKDNYQIIYSTFNPSQLELFHDTVPPVSTGTMTCSRDMNGVCRSAATVKLNATDTGTNGDPGSGVLKIECSYDNKTTWQQCGDVNGGQIVFSKNGKTSFYYRGTDRVLNVEAAKYSGVIDVEQFLSVADTLFKSDSATTLKTTGIAHSNGNMSFINNTTVALDILTYIGSFTQSGNTTFTYNSKTQVTQTNPIPSYPLSFYKTKCPNYTGPLTIWDTSPSYNKCMYVTGDVTFNATTPTGKLTIVSEGYIKDNSTNANLQAWDTTNGILFYSAKGYTTTANGAIYTGVIYAPTTQINGAFSNTTLNGSLYSKTVSFGSGTSLTAKQAAGFPATTYTLPL